MVRIKGIYIRIGNEVRKLMIDSGASVSIIKKDKVPRISKWDKNYEVSINGICGNVDVKGKITVGLEIEDRLVNQEFLVMDKFKSNFDGILGMDFLNKYKAVINYDLNTILITINGKNYTNQLVNENIYNITIPRRSEIILYLNTSCKEDSIVIGEELEPGIVVANMIVRPINGKIPIRIMNVTSEDKNMQEFKPKVEKLSDYKIARFMDNEQDVDRVRRVLNKLDLNHLNSEEKDNVQRICGKYSDIFYLEGDRLSTTNIMDQTIHLKPNATPVYIKPYRLPHSQKAEIDKQVNKMLEDGIAEEACCEWSSPLLLVPKKTDKEGNKKFRVVVDYRKVNDKIQDDKFPLPCISDILDSLGGAIYFSHLDLSQGYHQVPLTQSCRNITAFSTDRGQFRLCRLPQGLKISPSAFSRLMTVAMSGLNYKICFIYLDDIICFGKNLKEHNQNLIKIFERLRHINLKLNPIKCEFLCKQINFLGHLISKDGISPDPEKVKVLKDYPIPKDASEAKRFTAFANYYRRHINNFAQIAKPLHNLNKKNVDFVWTKECQVAFEKLKNSLVIAPVLDFPNFDINNEFILRTDASGYAVGAVLSNSNDKPIAYASRMLNKAEQNYCTIEKELLAIVWAIKHYRPYLFARKFKILTDHKPLIYLFGMSNPSSRLTKFRIAIEEYDFTIEYVKGSENVTADALSRISSDELKRLNKEIVNVVTRSATKSLQTNEMIKPNSDNSRSDQPKVVELLKQPKNVPELFLKVSEIITKDFENETNKICINVENDKIIVKSLKSPMNLNSFLKELDKFCKRNKVPKVVIRKNETTNVLINKLKDKSYRNILQNVKIIVLASPKEVHDIKERLLILNDFHMLPTGGHAGVNRMYQNVSRKYKWPNLVEDIKKFIKNCKDCQICKYSTYTKVPMVITTTPNRVFQRITLDLVGPLPEDNCGHKYILTIQDELSKYVEGYPITNKESITVAKSFVQNFILKYGVPNEILTDRGTEFMSQLFKNISIALGIQKLNSTSYHHQTIGSLENTHKNLNSFLRMKLQKSNIYWNEWINYWCFAFNTTIHSSTGYSPYEVVFGRKCRIPSNIQVENYEDIFGDYVGEIKHRIVTAENEVKENLNRVKEVRKTKYDEKLKPIQYKFNDKILVKNETGNKFKQIWNGPYSVIIDVEPNVVIKNENNQIELVHKNRTKLYNT